MKEEFHLLNNYYDKILVLSVNQAVERRMRFDENFSGLEYSFFYGADKNELNFTDLQTNAVYNEGLARKHHRYSKSMNAGEIACAWSHRMLYEEMLLNNYHRLMIFEDDVLPDAAMLKKTSQILNEIPSDCELLMWGWAKNGELTAGGRIKQLVYHAQHALGFLKWEHVLINNYFARPYSAHLKTAGFHDYTYAYGISRSAAEKLVKMQTPIQYIADNLLAHACTKKIVSGYIVHPPAFLHDSLPGGKARDSYIR